MSNKSEFPRREFLKNSTVATTGAIVLTTDAKTSAQSGPLQGLGGNPPTDDYTYTGT